MRNQPNRWFFFLLIIRLDINRIFTIIVKQWTSSVVVNMSACHAEDRGFESRLVRHLSAGVVQW
jgi:hypothetical protein